MKLPRFKPIHFIPHGTKFKFAHHWRLALVETIGLALATVVLMSTLGLNYGIDFRGGTTVTVRATDGPADIPAIRAKLAGLGLGEVQVQEFDKPTDVRIVVEEQPGGEKAQQATAAKVRAALGDKIDVLQVDVVGATVSGELVWSAIWALLAAALVIFLYIWFRFEWQFSVSALIALFHDLAMVVCLFSIFQFEFDLTIVAALLTLIGYAVNDTVVSFDRVRENLRKYKKMPLDQLIDLSMNETLSRTAMTAGAVLVTLVALIVFGGPVIRGFIMAMLFGTAVSTYTSLFVAAPLLYLIGVKRDWSGAAVAKTISAAAPVEPRPKPLAEPRAAPEPRAGRPHRR